MKVIKFLTDKPWLITPHDEALAVHQHCPELEDQIFGFINDRDMGFITEAECDHLIIDLATRTYGGLKFTNLLTSKA
jgi:hypothetical protein